MILKVTWNATTDATTWVILNDDNGEVMGAVQVEGKPPEQRNSPRKYEIFGSQIGVPPEGGTIEAGILGDAEVLALWTKHQSPLPVSPKDEPDGTRASG